jgi:hypothetical protein
VKIEAEFESRLRAGPLAQVAVIVTTAGPPGEFVARAEALGLEVHRQYRLRHMLALRGPASAALALLDEPWVLSVEEDQPVTTMGGQSPPVAQ